MFKGHGVQDNLNYMMNAVMALSAWALAYTGLPAEPAIILTVIMMLDFASGVARAYIVDGQVSSKVMKAGVIGKLLVLLIPLIIALAAKGLSLDWHWLAGWCITVLILSETYSFIANLYNIKTRQNLPEWDAVAMIGNRLRAIIIDIVNTGGKP